MGKKNKRYTVDFKSRVALDAIKGELTTNQLTTKYSVSASQIHRWKDSALKSIKSGFNGKLETSLQEC